MGVTSIEGLDGNFCTDDIQTSFTLRNFGTEPITTATIEVTINGVISQTFDTDANLASGASVTIPLTISGFIDGTNEISISASNPNGLTDEVMDNNAFGRTFQFLEDGAIITLSITTDQFPNETTWELNDLQGNTIGTGGPYSTAFTTITEEFCLDPDLCYNFVIRDSYGDGIDGDFGFTDEMGQVLLDGDGDFGFQSSSIFCATFVCMLNADFDISATSTVGASDGTILVSPNNGTAPFQFSIDGGQNFQTSPTFNNLPAGDYTILIQDGSECSFEETVTVSSCTLAFTTNIENSSGSGIPDGRIIIIVSNGTPPYQYSINAGIDFTGFNIFSNLVSGDYPIVVRDALGCISTQSAIVDLNTDVENVSNQQLTIDVAPNPTKGIFRINVNGLNKSNVFLNIEVFDVNGKRIQESSIARYDNTYTGQVSLIHYPSGTYFVRFVDKDINRLVKVIKE